MPNHEEEEQPPARPKQPYSSVFFEARLDLARRGFVPPPFNLSTLTWIDTSDLNLLLTASSPNLPAYHLQPFSSFCNKTPTQPSSISFKISLFIFTSLVSSTLNIQPPLQPSITRYFFLSLITSSFFTSTVGYNVIATYGSVKEKLEKTAD